MTPSHTRELLAVALVTLAVGSFHVDAQRLVPTAELAKRGLTAQDFPRLTELANNVFAYEDVHVQGEITTNNLIVIGSDGVLVVDGQGTPEQVERLLAEVARLTSQPIRYVVVGSHHGDHTGGYASFPATVTLIAHPTSRAALGDRATGPVETVTDRRVVSLGDTDVEVLHLGRAHTGGDLVVHVPSARVLFMSESYLHRMFPSVAGGYPSEWIAAISRAEAMGVDAFIPGHGFVDDRETLRDELSVFRQALETLVSEGRRLRDAGVSAEDAATQANLGAFGDWSLREAMAPRGMARVYAELNGELD